MPDKTEYENQTERIAHLEECIGYALHCLFEDRRTNKCSRPDTARAALLAAAVEPTVNQPTGIFK